MLIISPARYFICYKLQASQITCLLIWTHETCSTMHPKALPHLENWSRHDCQLAFWPFLLDKTMTTHFLSLLHWQLMLADSIYIPFHPQNMVYHVLQGIPRLFRTWKTGPTMTASQHSGYFYWIYLSCRSSAPTSTSVSSP